MTKEELAQKIIDSNYTCTGIKCSECISVNGFECCLQDDRALFVSMFLPTKKQKLLKKIEKIFLQWKNVLQNLKRSLNKHEKSNRAEN